MAEFSLNSGTRLGPYEILSPLGRGGMGEVYRARDTRLRRDVAIKVLSVDAASDAKRSRFFEQEARSASALNHPNIVTIYDIGHSNFGSYIAMEFVEGKTLREILADGPLPSKRMLHVAAQIADGLAVAHAAGIFHRDLKPENLIITKDGLVKIVDFGLAKFVRPPIEDEGSQTAPSAQATEPGVILGTVGYMSPEQASGLPSDFWSDQFSFGAILYEMATGQRAFQRATPVETLSAIIRDEPEPVASINPKVLPPCRWIIERCLAKNVEDRYVSTRDLAREIQNLRDHISELAASDITNAVAPSIEVSKRFRAFATGVVAALVLALGIGVFLWRASISAVPTFSEITFGHGAITSARFAADGKSVIYGASWVGQASQLFIAQPGNPESRALGLNNAGIWSVSSSGEMAIAYPCTLNWSECIGTLALVPAAGGTPREILDDVNAADWAPDGKTLVVAQFVGRKNRIVQYPSEKVLYETEGWVTRVRFSPKGDRVGFLDHATLGDISGSVSVLDLMGNKRVLSSGWKALQGLAWSPSGDQIWFTGSKETKGGTGFNLFAVNLSGTEWQVLSTPGTIDVLDISQDGHRVLVRHFTPRAILIGLLRGESKERELSWFDFSTAADLSSDGKTLLFYEWGNGVRGNETAYLRKSDGSDPKRLGNGKPLALSPDGQWTLALQQTSPPQLVLLPTGLGKPKPLQRSGIGEFLHWAAWSPDGGRIFFAAAEPGKRPRTWAQYIDGLPEAVTPEGMTGTLLAPDGKLIAAVDRYQQYYLYPVDGGEPVALEGYDEGDVLLQWSNDGGAIFLRGPGDTELNIYRLDIKTGSRQLWKQLTPPYLAGLIGIGADPGQVRITPDGQAYVYTFWTAPGELYLAEGLK